MVITLTHDEVRALNAILDEAIVQSEAEGVDPVFHEVDVDSVNPFDDTLTQSNVYDSLAKNGLIQCSGTEDERGGEILEFVCITPDGWKALKSAKGVH
jgi:hypothetical protein